MIRLKRLYANNFKQLQDLELHFPDQARVLVQGKNEAGKSTLFEALFFALFGRALATETGTRGLDDLIRYGVEKSLVELDVQCGARLFQIRRTIVRGKSNVGELDVARDGAIVEEIRGNSVVNKRLVAELGFDGDALLNTCFVEQKKLEKLEGLSRAKREESLARLLNLDALVHIENDLKIGTADRQELDRLKKRADLAEVQAELPAQEEKLKQVEQQLKLIDLRGAVNGAVSERLAVQQLDVAIQTLTAQRDAAARRVERIDALKEAMLSVKDARDAVERAAERAGEIERLRQEQAEARRIAEGMPALQARERALRQLARLCARLDQIHAAREANATRAAQLAQAEARLVELNAQIAREEETLAGLQARLRDGDLADALDEWMAARGEIVSTDEMDAALAARQVARDRLARRFQIQVYGLAALALAFVIAAALAQPFALVFIAAAALVVILLATQATRLWSDLSRAMEELEQTRGEARTRASAREAQQARLRQAEARLAQLDAVVPATMQAARVQRAALPQASRDELRAEQDAARERVANARAIVSELLRQHALANATDLTAARARSERVARKAEALLANWRARAETRAAALDVAPTAEAVQRARYQLDAQVEPMLRRADEAARLEQEIARREQQMQTFLTRAREAYERARAVKPAARAWDTALTPDDCTAFGKDLRAEYDVLGGEGAVRQAREIEGELGRRQGERATRARNADLLLARTRELIGGVGNLSDAPTLAELQDLAARLQTLELGDEATLRLQHREGVGRVHSLRDRRTQLERELGFTGKDLDPVACRNEWIERAREHWVRECGVEIVSTARRRIIQKVLPATMDYMRRILPTLTRDRYHDAQLDAETYKIQAWDERAGAFKEKNIFSGGTRDQFSLALRLAFALATLPQERGAAPSFIFLDEPLGSFDDERADALIYLLTEGEIARAFDQIFLISHVHVDERVFTHRVVLENGRVVASDLPDQ